MPDLELKELQNKVRKQFEQKDLNADEQTLITLFLSSVKTFNILVLSKIEQQPLDWNVYKYMHAQFYKDSQLLTLLAKATKWSFNPFIYQEGTNLASSLWSQANLQNYLMGSFEKDKRFFRYLALSHAFKSEVRLMPLFPADKKLDTPFLTTLHDIEVENGKEIQTQAMLLKNLEVPSFSVEEKEQILRDQRIVVSSHFKELLRIFDGVN